MVTPIRENITSFVKCVKRSYDKLTTESYGEAYESLEKASAGMIRLCRYKNEHLPNVDSELCRECSEAYRALPEPKADIFFNPTRIVPSSGFVQNMIDSYEGRSRMMGPSKPLGKLSNV